MTFNIMFHINSNLDTFGTVQLLFFDKKKILTKFFFTQKILWLEILNQKLNLDKKVFQLKAF